MSDATTGVLAVIAEAIATGSVSFAVVPNDEYLGPSNLDTTLPVFTEFWMALAMTNKEPMTKITGLLKPLNASSGVMIPTTKTKVSALRNTIAGGNIFLINAMINATTTIATKMVSNILGLLYYSGVVNLI